MEKIWLRLVGECLAVRCAAESTYHTISYFVKSVCGKPQLWWDVRPFMRCTDCQTEWMPKCAVEGYGCQLCEKCREQLMISSFRKKEIV
jgi:hypothetical protein